MGCAVDDGGECGVGGANFDDAGRGMTSVCRLGVDDDLVCEYGCDALRDRSCLS